MFEKLNLNMKRVYPMIVVSTMSSGKSTLINALVGKELLPSKNTACTAKAVAILDNDLRGDFRIYAVDKDGKYYKRDNIASEEIENYNETNDLNEIIIEGEVQGIRNSKKALLVIDTPGINNSMNKEHGDITKSILGEYTDGLLLYVINAEQMGTKDDDALMNLVVERLKKSPELNIIFAINKMDAIDPVKENPSKYISNCKKYVGDHGIKDPILIPVSARDALIFEEILNDETLSETDEIDFTRAYKKFKREGFSLVDYISAPSRDYENETVEVDGEIYTKAAIYAALENTGLPALEVEIDNALAHRVKMRAPRVTLKRE